MSYLDVLVGDIVNIVKPFTEDKTRGDMNLLPPFIVYLVYKAAETVTENLPIYDYSKASLERLKVFRRFLRLISDRWLAGGK